MHKWTIEQDCFLFNNWQELTVSQIANRLKISKAKVRERIALYELRQDDSKFPTANFKRKLLKIHGKNSEDDINKQVNGSFLINLIKVKLEKDKFTPHEAEIFYDIPKGRVSVWLRKGLAPTGNNIKKVKEAFDMSENEFLLLSKIAKKKATENQSLK